MPKCYFREGMGKEIEGAHFDATVRTNKMDR